MVLAQCAVLAGAIAAKALEIGFLIRGGATIAPLYHKDGVVFGKALIEAYQIESRTSHFPRIVLSDAVTRRVGWHMDSPFTRRDPDGLFSLDYLLAILTGACFADGNQIANVGPWFNAVVPIIGGKLQKLERDGHLTALSKWNWFARNFRETTERLNPKIRETYGLDLSRISW